MLRSLLLILALCLALAAALAVSAPAAKAHSIELPATAYGSPIPGSIIQSQAVRAKAKPSYKISGRRWPGRTIRIYDGTPISYRRGMNAAINEWNARGLGVRFVKVKSARQAQVVMRHDRRIHAGGQATLGYNSYFSSWVKMNMPRANWADVAWVASHELGHVLGLDHSTGCSVMSYSAYSDCVFPTHKWEWRCRLQERADLLGVRKLYGGAIRPRPKALCLRNPAAAPVAAPTALPGDRLSIATLSWARPARAKSFSVARSVVGGECETNFAAATQADGLAYTDAVSEWEVAAAGRYCYSIWSHNVDGAPTGPTRVYVDYAPPLPATVSGLAATFVVDEWGYPLVNVTWTPIANATSTVILRSEPNGPCLTDRMDYDHQIYSDGAGAVSDYGPYAGGLISGATFCYTVLTSDDARTTLWSAPTTVHILIP